MNIRNSFLLGVNVRNSNAYWTQIDKGDISTIYNDMLKLTGVDIYGSDAWNRTPPL